MNRRRFCTGLAVLAAVGVLIVLMTAGPMQAADPPISAVHLTLTGKPASVVLTWRAPQASGDAVVKVWPARLATMPQGGKDLITVKPVQHSYRYLRDDVHVYDATIEGLAPGTDYNYQISCGGATAPVYSFPAPVDSVMPFTFAVLGDCRGNYVLNGKILKTVREAGARFVLYVGDMTDSGTQLEWDIWFRDAAESLPYLPIMTVHGSHECLTKAYFEQFVLPSKDERNYFFDYGMIRFVILYDNSETSFLQDAIPFTKASLATTPPQAWKVIAMHRPPYASVPYILDSMRDGIAAAAEECGVEALFSGHRHTYERTFPLLGGKPAENGVTYVITGGAGAPLDQTALTAYTAKAESMNHFILVSVTADKLLCTVKTPDGSTLDEFAVAKRH